MILYSVSYLFISIMATPSGRTFSLVREGADAVKARAHVETLGKRFVTTEKILDVARIIQVSHASHNRLKHGQVAAFSRSLFLPPTRPAFLRFNTNTGSPSFFEVRIFSYIFSTTIFTYSVQKASPKSSISLISFFLRGVLTVHMSHISWSSRCSRWQPAARSMPSLHVACLVPTARG